MFSKLPWPFPNVWEVPFDVVFADFWAAVTCKDDGLASFRIFSKGDVEINVVTSLWLVHDWGLEYENSVILNGAFHVQINMSKYPADVLLDMDICSGGEVLDEARVRFHESG
jgi:hypothetical protein